MFKTILLVAALAAASSSANPLNVFKIDISPEEAQQYLSSPPFSEPQLSAKTATLPLVRFDSPSFRSAEAGPTLGHYWRNGKEIENTDDYIEEVYDAAQYHGQDGLGGYGYGYETPQSSKVENRAQSGDVQGSYTYITGNNELIKVRYWADSEGFHQEDNLPKPADLQPPQETEEVREARLAHEKAWQEAAAAAAQQPDPQGEYDQYSGSASDQQHTYAVAPQAQSALLSGGSPTGTPQSTDAAFTGPTAQAPQTSDAEDVVQPGGPNRAGKAYYSAQAQAQNVRPFQQQNQQYGQQKQVYQQQGSYKQQGAQQGYQQQGSQQSYQQQGSQQSYQQQGNQQKGYQQQEDEVEPTGPPRGFFYSFNYPVSVIVAKNGQQQEYPGQPIDHDTVGVNSGYRSASASSSVQLG